MSDTIVSICCLFLVIAPCVVVAATCAERLR
jgi:hypothetical protein